MGGDPPPQPVYPYGPGATVRAVVRGVAVNNDGRRKVGFVAPGQGPDNLSLTPPRHPIAESLDLGKFLIFGGGLKLHGEPPPRPILIPQAFLTARAPPSSLVGQAEVVRQALADARLRGSDVGLVECHGTGTLIGDPLEVAALTEVYRRHTDRRRGLGLLRRGLQGGKTRKLCKQSL